MERLKASHMRFKQRNSDLAAKCEKRRQHWLNHSVSIPEFKRAYFEGNQDYAPDEQTLHLRTSAKQPFLGQARLTLKGNPYPTAKELHDERLSHLKSIQMRSQSCYKKFTFEDYTATLRRKNRAKHLMPPNSQSIELERVTKSIDQAPLQYRDSIIDGETLVNLKMREVDPKQWMSKRDFFLRKSQADAEYERGYEPFNPKVSLAEILRKRKAGMKTKEDKFKCAPTNNDPYFKECYLDPSQGSLRASLSNQSQMLIRESQPANLSPKSYHKSAQSLMKRDRYSSIDSQQQSQSIPSQANFKTISHEPSTQFLKKPHGSQFSLHNASTTDITVANRGSPRYCYNSPSRSTLNKQPSLSHLVDSVF